MVELLAGVDHMTILDLLIVAEIGCGFDTAEIDVGEEEVSTAEDDDQHPDDCHEDVERILLALTAIACHDLFPVLRVMRRALSYFFPNEKPMLGYFKREKYSNIGS